MTSITGMKSARTAVEVDNSATAAATLAPDSNLARRARLIGESPDS
ncbi:MAG TPA: hypothetical protein VFE60_27505 [Roseiarcus sp.]|nr:hypothetical protein [Roseiarcus sp.]